MSPGRNSIEQGGKRGDENIVVVAAVTKTRRVDGKTKLDGFLFLALYYINGVVCRKYVNKSPLRLELS